MQFDLKSIGLTQEELQARVVASITDQILTTRFSDEDGYEDQRQSKFMDDLKKLAKDGIDAKVREIADNFVVPQISELVETISLQATNTWGEKTGEGPVTFIEYLIKRADDYMKEQVNYNGKTRAEDSYSWTPKSTRIVHLVNSHLQFSIETAMKKALSDANKSIAGGLEAAVKMALQEAQAKLQVTTKID